MPLPIDDETRLSDVKATSSSPSGWLSSSDAIAHGRFAPGTLLGGRYRIVGQLGRGGMGEVFRADDLKLGTELDRFFTFAGFAMLNTGFTWLFYLGLEPYVRRLCPDVLISWTRLLSGNVRDPRVGRGVLVGIAAGVLFAMLGTGQVLIPGAAAPGQLQGSTTAYFLGTRYALSTLVRLIPNALQTTMLVTFLYVVLVALVRRRWIAIGITLVLCVSVIASESSVVTPWAAVAMGTVVGLTAIFTLLRFGLLTISFALLTNLMLRNVSLTADMTRSNAPMAALTLLIVGGAAAYAFYLSRAGEGMLRRLLPA